MVVIFSMPSTNRAVRVRRRTKTKRAGEGWQAEMHGAVHDVKSVFAALHDVADLAEAGLRDFLCGAGKSVHAADFLHRSGGDGKELAADAKQNDLLGANGWRVCGSGEAHYLAPTGVMRLADANDAFFDGGVNVVEGEEPARRWRF